MSAIADRPRAIGEWKAHWYLPLVAMLGTAASVIPFYSTGPFIEPLSTAFGWSRAEISAGILVSNGISAVLSVLVGLLIDRFGPRPVGIFGIVAICCAFGALGLLTGTLPDWYMHWVFVGLGSLTVQTTIWASAVSSRFTASRGLAIAVTMCGNGLAASAMPVVAAVLIERYGFRTAFAGVGLVWLVVFLPPVVLFFRGAQDVEKRRAKREKVIDAPALPGLTMREGLRTSAFYKLGAVGAIYSLVLIGTVVHLVPILVDRGRDPVGAAAIAGFVGLASIFGRLGTGMLLDRVRGTIIAPLAMLVPAIALTLLAGTAPSVTLESLAAMILGFSIGAELDVVTYLASRYMGLKSFGSLFAAMLTLLSLGTALGPYTAGTTFDMTGSYAPFLYAGIPAMALCAFLLATLGRYPDFAGTEGRVSDLETPPSPRDRADDGTTLAGPDRSA